MTGRLCLFVAAGSKQQQNKLLLWVTGGCCCPAAASKKCLALKMLNAWELYKFPAERQVCCSRNVHYGYPSPSHRHFIRYIDLKEKGTQMYKIHFKGFFFLKNTTTLTLGLYLKQMYPTPAPTSPNPHLLPYCWFTFLSFFFLKRRLV